MEELCAWDLDGTIRPGSLLAEAIAHGSEAGFIDLSMFKDPASPSYDEVEYFIKAITNQSRQTFKELMDRLSEEAILQSYDWAVERIEHQSKENHVVVFSHSPDFLVRAFVRGIASVKRGRGSYFHTAGLVFSGRSKTLNKQQAVSRYLREQRIDYLGFAAGDTRMDVPIIKRAKQGLVVNPDEELAGLAEFNNWEVIYANK